MLHLVLIQLRLRFLMLYPIIWKRGARTLPSTQGMNATQSPTSRWSRLHRAALEKEAPAWSVGWSAEYEGYLVPSRSTIRASPSTRSMRQKRKRCPYESRPAFQVVVSALAASGHVIVQVS